VKNLSGINDFTLTYLQGVSLILGHSVYCSYSFSKGYSGCGFAVLMLLVCQRLEDPDIFYTATYSTGKPEEQQFTIQSGVLIGTDSRQHNLRSSVVKTNGLWTCSVQLDRPTYAAASRTIGDCCFLCCWFGDMKGAQCVEKPARGCSKDYNVSIV